MRAQSARQPRRPFSARPVARRPRTASARPCSQPVARPASARPVSALSGPSQPSISSRPQSSRPQSSRPQSSGVYSRDATELVSHLSGRGRTYVLEQAWDDRFHVQDFGLGLEQKSKEREKSRMLALQVERRPVQQWSAAPIPQRALSAPQRPRSSVVRARIESNRAFRREEVTTRLKAHLEQCWEQQQVPHFHRELYAARYFHLSDPDALLQEAERLAAGRAAVQALGDLLHRRQLAIARLRDLDSQYADGLVPAEEARAQAKSFAAQIRGLTLDVVDAVVSWRTELATSDDVPSWRVATRGPGEEDLLLCLPFELGWLASSALAELIPFSKQPDPFLLFCSSPHSLTSQSRGQPLKTTVAARQYKAVARAPGTFPTLPQPLPKLPPPQKPPMARATTCFDGARPGRAPGRSTAEIPGSARKAGSIPHAERAISGPADRFTRDGGSEMESLGDETSEESRDSSFIAKPSRSRAVQKKPTAIDSNPLVSLSRAEAVRAHAAELVLADALAARRFDNAAWTKGIRSLQQPVSNQESDHEEDQRPRLPSSQAEKDKRHTVQLQKASVSVTPVEGLARATLLLNLTDEFWNRMNPQVTEVLGPKKALEELLTGPLEMMHWYWLTSATEDASASLKRARANLKRATLGVAEEEAPLLGFTPIGLLAVYLPTADQPAAGTCEIRHLSLAKGYNLQTVAKQLRQFLLTDEVEHTIPIRQVRVRMRVAVEDDDMFAAFQASRFRFFRRDHADDGSPCAIMQTEYTNEHDDFEPSGRLTKSPGLRLRIGLLVEAASKIEGLIKMPHQRFSAERYCPLAAEATAYSGGETVARAHAEGWRVRVPGLLAAGLRSAALKLDGRQFSRRGRQTHSRDHKESGEQPLLDQECMNLVEDVALAEEIAHGSALQSWPRSQPACIKAEWAGWRHEEHRLAAEHFGSQAQALHEKHEEDHGKMHGDKAGGLEQLELDAHWQWPAHVARDDDGELVLPVIGRVGNIRFVSTSDKSGEFIVGVAPGMAENIFHGRRQAMIPTSGTIRLQTPASGLCIRGGEYTVLARGPTGEPQIDALTLGVAFEISLAAVAEPAPGLLVDAVDAAGSPSARRGTAARSLAVDRGTFARQDSLGQQPAPARSGTWPSPREEAPPGRAGPPPRAGARSTVVGCLPGALGVPALQMMPVPIAPLLDEMTLEVDERIEESESEVEDDFEEVSESGSESKTVRDVDVIPEDALESRAARDGEAAPGDEEAEAEVSGHAVAESPQFGPAVVGDAPGSPSVLDGHTSELGELLEPAPAEAPSGAKAWLGGPDAGREPDAAPESGCELFSRKASAATEDFEASMDEFEPVSEEESDDRAFGFDSDPTMSEEEEVFLQRPFCIAVWHHDLDQAPLVVFEAA